MAEKPPATYEELTWLRANEWATAQATAAKTLAEQHALFASMPDVKGAPRPDIPWTHPDIVCPCGGVVFLVPRWVTVNGLKYRAELACTECQRVDTWGWTEGAWLP
jgi:hypothetical protein